jgi:hypothetical protein
MQQQSLASKAVLHCARAATAQLCGTSAAAERHRAFVELFVVCLQVIKYGVISLAAFQQDLQHWSHLYVGGRLHKPVAALCQHAAAEAACQQNLQSALTASLLLLPTSSSLKVREW